MRILLVYPRYPDTFWGFRHALKFVSKRACFPPLGLMTVAAMLPADWGKRLLDMNVQPLSDQDLLWGDYVFVSAMTIQRDSVKEILSRCRKLGVKSVVGGPLFTSCPEEFGEADHLVLNEAEVTLPPFLKDLAEGRPQRIYASQERADINSTPVPLWELVDIRNYAAMNIQYSRGCPFDCEFCDITGLFGRVPRTKNREQLLDELEALYKRGWRGSVFFVDDNFIGDRNKLKKEILPTLIDWMKAHHHPFAFFTEASVNLADDEQLMDLMVQARFEEVFIGIESPEKSCLDETGKIQNRDRDLLSSVRKIHEHGLQVQGGFIVGFDNDPASIFERHIRFIQESGIVTAMVGMLTAVRGTRLYQRLLEEGRLLRDTSGNNTAIALNFVPKMNVDSLVNGYRSILATIYSPRYYYQRVNNFLRAYRPLKSKKFHFHTAHLAAVVKSMLFLGVIGKERLYYWRLFFWSAIRKPKLFPLAITFAIYGFHFRKISEKIKYSGMFEENGCAE